tara:strand:- start:36173 stop:37288 length:1116 start_codon:yes stop_codon:yes gene_type:complete
MRILIINWRDIRNPEAGGAEIHLHQTFTRIVALNHEVTLLCSKFPGAKDLDKIDGIEIIRYGGKWTFNITALWYYRKYLVNREFDILIEDINKIPFFLPLFSKKPRVMVLLHHLFGKNFYRETNLLFATYLYFMEWLIPRVYQHCCFEVVSESCRDELFQKGIPLDNINVVYNGLDVAFKRVSNNFEDKDPNLVVYLGRLKKYKNVDHLIQAMVIVREQVPEVRLIIGGTGDQRESLEKLVWSKNLEEIVSFTGYVSESEKIGLLTRASVAAYPSNKEGWGITVIEANACGTPVVATEVPGLSEAVLDGETGVLTPLADPNAMAEGLIRLLNNRRERERLAQNAIVRSRLYDWDNTAQKTVEIIGEAMGEC